MMESMDIDSALVCQVSAVKEELRVKEEEKEDHEEEEQEEKEKEVKKEDESMMAVNDSRADIKPAAGEAANDAELVAVANASTITEDEAMFELIRCDHDPPVKDAVFLLEAPNSLWFKSHDWVNSPPCDLKIKMRF